MADGVEGEMNLNPQGWASGLKTAQEAAGKFVAFMTGLNSKLAGVADGSIAVANAMASIGATSAAVKAELESLAAGKQTIADVQAKFGSTTEQMISQVRGILAGNAKQITSFNLVATEIDQVTASLMAKTNALKELEAIQTKIAARKIVRDPNLGQTTARKGKSRSLAVFQSTDPMDYENADEIAIARKLQKIQRLREQYNLGAIPKGFEIPMGEGKQSLAMARLNMLMEQTKLQITGITDAQRTLDKEAKETWAVMNRGMKTYVATIIQTQKEVEELRAKQMKLRATAVRRELDSMYMLGPGAGRAKELQSAGVIKSFGNIQQAAKNSHSWTDKLFMRFEKGTAIATKGTMALVRGLNSAQSAMAFMTSSFAGLVAMIGGATIGGFFKMSMDFEKAMTRVNLLVKKGESDLGTLTAQVKEISKMFGTGPTETAAAFRIAISSDIPPEEIMSFMKEASKLAVTHQASIEKTTDLLAMLRNAFGLAIKDMSSLRDMIFIMTDRGRVEVEQFADEIGKIAPTARLAGVNVREMMAMFAALSRTRSTEQAGTLLRNLFKNIIEPSKDAATQLKKIQLGLTPVQTAAHGALATVTKFREELKKHPELLNDVAEDLRELAAWGELTDSQFAALTSTFEEMGVTMGIGNAKAKEMMDTTSVRWDRLMAQMKISAMDMVQGVVESFAGITKGVGGVELAQEKIKKMFMQIELAIRLMMAVAQVAGIVIVAAFSAVAAVLYTAWKAAQSLATGLSTASNMFDAKRLVAQFERVNDAIERLKVQLGDRDEPVLKAKMAELVRQREEIQKKLTAANDKIRENDKELLQTFEEWAQGLSNLKKPTAEMAKAISDNNLKVDELMQSIADCNHVIEQMEIDAMVAAKAADQYGISLGKLEEAARNTTLALAEALRATTEQTVKLGAEGLKQWLTDNRDTIQGIITGYRKLATEQEQLVSSMRKQLKDLIKDQRDFDDSVNDTIDKIKDVDRTPEQKIQRLKDRGLEMESRANQAAKEGDREEVQRLLQQAMGYYQEILSVSDTKKNREEVISALERLKGEMDKVYGSEKAAISEKMATAEKAAKHFTAMANQVEGHFKAFEQGIRDITREIENLSKTPSMEVLTKLKDKISALIGSSDFFIQVQADPALSALDKMIEKAKEFGAEMKKAFNVPEIMPTPEQVRGMEGFIPLSSTATRDNTTIHNRITNVDSLSVNTGGEAGGPKKADARRLARDIKRHIERGEAPALTRRK